MVENLLVRIWRGPGSGRPLLATLQRHSTARTSAYLHKVVEGATGWNQAPNPVDERLGSGGADPVGSLRTYHVVVQVTDWPEGKGRVSPWVSISNELAPAIDVDGNPRPRPVRALFDGMSGVFLDQD